MLNPRDCCSIPVLQVIPTDLSSKYIVCLTKKVLCFRNSFIISYQLSQDQFWQMFAKTIRLFRFTFSEYINPKKQIVVFYCSPFSKYTFLDIQSATLDKSFEEKAHNLKSSKLTQFLTLLRAKQVILKQVQRSNYSCLDIKHVHFQQSIGNRIFGRFKRDIIEIADCYGHLIEQIVEQSKSQNVVLWVDICLKLKIIDTRIWSHISKLVYKRYNLLSLNEKIYLIKALQSYLQCSFVKKGQKINKFLYRQNYLADLEYLQHIVSKFLKEVISENPQYRRFNVEQLFEISYQLMQRINFGSHLQINKLRDHFSQRPDFYHRFLTFTSVDTAILLLQYLSFIGVFNLEAVTMIQRRILKLLRTNVVSPTDKKRVTSVFRLIKIWGIFTYNNPDIYQNFIRPVLIEQLSSNQTQLDSNVLYSILCSAIQDDELVQNMVTNISSRYPIQNRTAHIILHYLSIKRGRKHFTSYAQCIPNAVARQIAKNSSNTYSNCMERDVKDYPSNSQVPNSSHSVKLSIYAKSEYHPPEQLWLDFIQLAFEELNQRYPNPKNKFIRNFQFCSFEIDALIILNQQYIGVEYEGLHYKFYTKNELSKKGSKFIKDYILTGYGLKLLQIDSSDIIVRNISSFKDKQIASKYLIKKLQTLYHSTPEHTHK